MESGRIHLPPIQDMLCKPLSFTEEPTSPISPVSSSCSSSSSNQHQEKKSLTTHSNADIHTYLDWEQQPRSADNHHEQQERMMIEKGYTKPQHGGKYNRNQEPLHRHSRSYSDQILPRRSPASNQVDPPHYHHRRTASDLSKRYQPLQVNNNNNNRYKCNQCLKTFSRPSSLRIHILSHTGEKPHVCPQLGCGRRFSVQSNMRRHLKVHYCNPLQPSTSTQQQSQGYI